MILVYDTGLQVSNQHVFEFELTAAEVRHFCSAIVQLFNFSTFLLTGGFRYQGIFPYTYRKTGQGLCEPIKLF